MGTPQLVSDTGHRSKLFKAGLKRNKDNRHTCKYHLSNFNRAYRSWLIPYLKSRYYSEQFRPVLSFLYTDLNCNLNCHYCYSRGRKIPGMSMEMAQEAINFLHSHGCRVLAYMGGEPLVRKKFIIALTRYAVQKGFFVYLPTNGILMDEYFIDEIGKAGVSTINLAVDAVNGCKGLPKYFNRIKKQFEYLVQQEKKYGYITFFNINITKNNIQDVKELTEIAHGYGIATDYHINEPPQVRYKNYEHEPEGGWITEKEYQAVDELVDWLIEKNLKGYTMVNSIDHLKAIKQFIRHQLPAWPCQAGSLSMIIRLDGTFAPCFELYGDQQDWGSLKDGAKFDSAKLARQKEKCSPHCLSTCNYQVKHYTQSLLYLFQWVAKHAYSHFLGVS
ncbi:MAG: radical SAM protein [Deltaproteobacteria bacterium]|nr:radical SAM protein [Deltaproteobacteria bacterium]